MLQVVEIKDGLIRVAGSYQYTLFEDFVIGTGKKTGHATVFDAYKGGALLFMNQKDFVATLGMVAKPLGKSLSAALSDKLGGRIIDAFGKPLDGFGENDAPLLPIIRPAVPIMERAPVVKPLLIGTTALDWIIPIGRGQRQLIIGDAGTGKTQLALNMILAQKNQNVACVYVAVGQKSSDVAACHAKLLAGGAMKYTTIVAATASDNALSRFAAPMTGMRLAELIAANDKDVLIVFDDLTRHAEAYRELSLLLQRSPGRESYPGDVFTLHASLLERSGAFVKKVGGGSITAVPITATIDEEITAFIPTNLISITDGQISISSDLFLQNVRPAIDLSQSVSRIGSRAQYVNVRAMSSFLKVDIAVYHEQKAFLQLTRENGSVNNLRMATIAVLPELLLQGPDEVIDPVLSLILLAVYHTGLLGGLRDVSGAIAEIKRVVHSPWFATIFNAEHAASYSGEEVISLVRAVFGPMLREMAEASGAGLGILETVPRDARLYELFHSAEGVQK